MTLSHHDPKLTAYVLGELDEADCREIEIAMEFLPELRKAVSEIRTVADALTEQLKVESTPQLDRVRREEIESALNGRSSAPAGSEDLRAQVPTGSAPAAPSLHSSDSRLGRPQLLSSTPAGVERAAKFGSGDAVPSPRGRGRGEGYKFPTGAGSRELKYAALARRLLIPLSLAASVALVFGITHYGLPELSRTREFSRPLVSASNSKSVGTSNKIFADAASTSGSGQSVFQGASSGTEDFKKSNGATPGERVALNAAPAPQSPAPQDASRKARAVIAPGAGGSRASRPMGPTINDPSMAEYKTKIEANQGKSVGAELEPNRPVALFGLGYVGSAADSVGDTQHLRMIHDARDRQQHASNEPYRLIRMNWEKSVSGVAGVGVDYHTGFEAFEDGDEELNLHFLLDPVGQEAYSPISENPFLTVLRDPLSTFSIDVDTASYSNVRRFLQQGTLPPRDAVRIEELINYFDYDYPLPTDEHPFSVNVEVAECPWAPDHRLARIGIKGMEFSERDRPAANLVFLIDVSGSMNQPNKLPLVRESLELLVNQLRRDDSVAMVVYAGASGLVLPPASGSSRDAILDAIDRLQSGGSTNAGAGIQLAYDTAIDHFVEGGVNRVILATDGDFNVGIQNREELHRLIEEKAKSGVFLSVLGYGMGNLKDGTLEMLADKGNGNYAYIDTINEAQKVLVDQMGGTLVTIAKDVKIQVEFNPAEVQSYRLIGYENRMLAAQDFNDDRKDAGEIGAGHTVTALYEIVPVGIESPDDAPPIDALKYQTPATKPRSHVATQGNEDQYRDREGAGLDDEQGTEDEEEIDNRQSANGNQDVSDETTPLDPPLARGEAGERLTPAAHSGELMTVKLRYKEPDEDVSKLIEVPVTDSGAAFADSSDDFAFAAAVASFGMLLRQSSYAKLHGASPSEAIDLFDYDFVRDVAGNARSEDPFGYRAEFLQLVERAKSLSAPAP